MRRFAIAAALLLASGCHQRMPNLAADREGASVLQGCDQAGRLLGQMATAEHSFTYDKSGNATVSEALWKQMPPELRDGLVKAVAYQAICAAGEAREQRVTIRSSETQRTLVEKTVSDFERNVAAP